MLLIDGLYVRGSHDPLSLGSINLLEWLRELRKSTYSLDQQFITKYIKEHESTARLERDTQGEVPKELLSSWSLGPAREHAEAFCFPNLEALCIPSFHVFMGASIHRHD